MSFSGGTFALTDCNFHFCLFHNATPLHKKSKNDTTVQPDWHWKWEGSIGKIILLAIIPPQKKFSTRVIFWALLVFLQQLGQYLDHNSPESFLGSPGIATTMGKSFCLQLFPRKKNFSVQGSYFGISVYMSNNWDDNDITILPEKGHILDSHCICATTLRLAWKWSFLLFTCFTASCLTRFVNLSNLQWHFTKVITNIILSIFTFKQQSHWDLSLYWKSAAKQFGDVHCATCTKFM